MHTITAGYHADTALIHRLVAFFWFLLSDQSLTPCRWWAVDTGCASHRCEQTCNTIIQHIVAEMLCNSPNVSQFRLDRWTLLGRRSNEARHTSNACSPNNSVQTSEQSHYHLPAVQLHELQRSNRTSAGLQLIQTPGFGVLTFWA